MSGFPASATCATIQAREDPSVMVAAVREQRDRATAARRPPESVSVTVHAAWPEREVVEPHLDALAKLIR